MEWQVTEGPKCEDYRNGRFGIFIFKEIGIYNLAGTLMEDSWNSVKRGNWIW